MSVLGSLWWNMHTVMKFVIKQLFLHISRRQTSTQETAHPCTTASFSSNHNCLHAACVHYGPLCRGALRHREDGTPRPRQQEDCQDGFVRVAQRWQTAWHRSKTQLNSTSLYPSSALHGTIHWHRQQIGPHWSSNGPRIPSKLLQKS